MALTAQDSRGSSGPGRGLLALAAAVVLAIGQPAAGQGAGDGLGRLNGAIQFTGQPGTIPPSGSEEIGITLSGVTLEGGLAAMQAANDAFVARLTSGRIPVAEIFDAAADLQADYEDAGFVLSRVILARQSLRDGGQLRVTVVNGVVEAVNTEAVPENIRPRVTQLTRPLVNRPGLQRSELERQLILAGEIPGTALEAGLAPGSSPGAAVIDLVPDYQPITGFVGYDNFLDDSLGENNLNFGVELNSMLGFGETIYARLSGAPSQMLSSDPVSRTFSLGALVPVGPSGAAVNLELTNSESISVGAFQTFQQLYERASVRFIYPVIRTTETSLTGSVVLDIVDDRTNQLFNGFPPQAVFRDRLTVLRFGLSGSRSHADGSVTEGALVYSRGLDALGAVTAAEAVFPAPPMTRFAADAVFSKTVLSFSHRRQLGEALTLSLGARAQSSGGETLVDSEKITLAGPQELSSFATGDVKGDSGWVARAELSTTLDLKLGGTPLAVSPYVFYARGAVRNYNPEFFEVGRARASSRGIGVDLFAKPDSAFRSGSVRIEYGKGQRDDFIPDENRVSVSGTFRF